MAKNKNKNKNAKNPEPETKSEPTATPTASAGGSQQPSDVPSAASAGGAPAKDLAAGASSGAAVDNMEQQQLKAEVLALRQQLAAKDTEIAQLKAELASAKPSLPAGTKIPDVEQLKERLANLKKEQEEADKARDTAWAQLKNVVGEIQKLANPDYVNSLVQSADSGSSQPAKTSA